VKRTLLVILILMVALSALGQRATDATQPNNVAHGSEKVAHETAHEEEGHHGELKFLGLPMWIWKLLNMLLFLGALIWALKGPVAGAFNARSEAIRAAAAEARERRVKADQMANDIQKRLADIENEVKAIHERAQAEGDRQKRELIAAAEAEAQKILQAARNEVDNRLKHARHELTQYAGQLASERAEAILREKITEGDQKKLFEDSLRQVGEVQS
jgi:F-type H+-transporting ATPase subunit b